MNAVHASRHAVTIVLAAGLGRRLGGPKARLAWPCDADLGGDSPAAEPLAWAHARARLHCESARVLVVTRAELADALSAWPVPAGAELVVSTEPDDVGPAGSIAAAARRLQDDHALSATSLRAIVTPVDCPPVRGEVVAALLAALEPAQARTSPVAARPRHEGQRGHPIAMTGELFTAYLGADRPSLRDVLRAHAPRVCDVEVSDPGVLADLDTLEDYARLTGTREPPRFLGAFRAA